jgi:hypothetical protein
MLRGHGLRSRSLPATRQKCGQEGIWTYNRFRLLTSSCHCKRSSWQPAWRQPAVSFPRAYGRGKEAWFKIATNRVALPTGGPPPPNDGSKTPEPAFFSGNSTPSANCLGWRRGVVFVKSCLTSTLFWPSANGLAWRKAPVRAAPTKYCYLILNHA